MPKKCLVFEAYPFFSGMERITLNVCKILRNKGYAVTLLLADDRYGVLKENFEPHVQEIKYIKVDPYLLKYGDEDSWFARKTMFRAIIIGLLPFYFRAVKTVLAGKYDYLYCCDPRGATMMFLPAVFFKKTSILHYHGKNRLPRPLAKLYLKVYNKVICVSQDVADSLPPSKNKTVVYNGIDFSQYENLDATTAENEAAAITGPTDKKVVNFLYAGLLRPHKGLHHLVPAFTHMVKDNKTGQKPVLFICGAAKLPAEQAYRDKLIAYCQAQGMEQNIFWLGWKNNVLAWMKFADYLVFPTIDKEPSIYEGFGKVIESSEGLPTVLIESSICDLYSIAADVTGVKEIITEGVNGTTYKNENAYGLYNALHTVLYSKPIVKGFPGSSNFSLKVFEKQMLAVFAPDGQLTTEKALITQGTYERN